LKTSIQQERSKLKLEIEIGLSINLSIKEYYLPLENAPQKSLFIKATEHSFQAWNILKT